ncbi:hypothetical protein [Candidatus Berkiella aquae]|uniref:Uncharacterized protein n=1 Tax=Candidatus Berkiella aquae TaxID=295108 RepID=A0A0Q9Z0G5_9GAMM|nr:hypothetical protein [Candidatus Berkiella aquae]MCS5711889.1 hypothetical protein [Candidatus Berkiella aquae]
MGRFTDRLNSNLIHKHSAYQRPLMQTYLTAPEWRNVEMAKELGRTLKKGTPFFQFPYFKQIAGFWRVFFQSYRVAKRHHSHREILFSEYMLMNLFIGCSITAGHLAKGITSLILFPFLRNQNQTTFQNEVGKVVSEYGDFLQHTPFYHFPYLRKLKMLWQAFKTSSDRSLIDYITMLFTTMESLTRQTISAPIAWWYKQPQNAPADKIHILVKSNKTVEQIRKVNREIRVIGKPYKKKNSKNLYYHLEVPRYGEFQKIVEKFATNQVQIKTIAGQEWVQVKVSASDKQCEKLNSNQFLYEYRNYVDKNKIVELDVKTKDLTKTVRQLKRNKIAIKLIHDF